jgi:hypothetical protein
MANFDPSCIKIFQAGDWSGVDPNKVFTIDTTATYAMIDANILAEALVGLTGAQQTVVNGYRYTPLATDFTQRGFPAWAGNDPVAVYFKAAGTNASQLTKLRAALAKRYS